MWVWVCGCVGVCVRVYVFNELCFVSLLPLRMIQLSNPNFQTTAELYLLWIDYTLKPFSPPPDLQTVEKVVDLLANNKGLGLKM